jgi:hypothetical protein
MFCNIEQFLRVPEEALNTMPPPPLASVAGTRDPLPPVMVNPSRTDAIVSPFSKITTLPLLPPLCGLIRIVVSPGPVSDWTVMALPRKVIGSVMTYSPGATKTVSASIAASIPAWMASKS